MRAQGLIFKYVCGGLNFLLFTSTAVKVQTDNMLHTCVAGGAEILGLHATVAPRRQGQQAPPVLEEFHFVPYREEDIYSGDEQLVKYVNDCMAQLQLGLDKMLNNDNTHPFSVQLKNVVSKMQKCCMVQQVSEDQLQIYSDDPKCGLMNTLQAVFSQEVTDQFAQNVQNLLDSHKAQILNDSLLGCLHKERTLKSCLDVVIENCPSSKLKVFEYGAAQSQLYNQVTQQLSTQPMLHLDYTAIDADASQSDVTHLENLGVKTATWNLEGDPPSHLKAAADVVLVHNLSTSQNDLLKSLSQLKLLVKDGGFVLLEEPTQNWSIPLVLNGLSKDFCISDTQCRSCGPFCDEEKWTEIFQKSGLEIIAQKSDGFLSTMFLCRAPVDLGEQTVIEVSDLSYSWVEEVKAALVKGQDSKVQGHRIWLKVTGSVDTHNGVVGMVNCLRQEPGGNRVRYVYVISL